jgi:site-specific recombinase XerD
VKKMRVYALDAEKETDFKKRLNYNYRLVYELGSATGLRISDIVSLKKEVLNKKEPTIKEQKTGKSKRIYIPVELKTELKKYSKNHKKYIFESRSKTGHLTRQAVHKHFKKIATEIECHENIGTHTMRKNYALKLLQKGKSLKYIKNKLNHDNLTDTLLYLMKNGF